MNIPAIIFDASSKHRLYCITIIHNSCQNVRGVTDLHPVVQGSPAKWRNYRIETYQGTCVIYVQGGDC